MPDLLPSLSIILPVLHEREIINNAIARLIGLQHDRAIEIIVVDGDPAAGTISSIKHPGVIRLTAETGRALQMNRGAAAASAEILLFLHADTVLPEDAPVLISNAMGDGRYSAGAFDLGIESDRCIFRITEKYAAMRTRLTRIPFGDQAIFIRRSYFEQLGGYRPIPLMEDVELMQRIKKRGDAIVLIPRKVRTSPRRWEREGLLFCTARNWALQSAYSLGLSPHRLARWYKQ